jgi:hypothetical protein
LATAAAAFALAPTVPPVAYHQARALALGGRTDSAITLLDRRARQGAVAVFEAPGDIAFTRLTQSRAWRGIAARIAEAQRPISHSSPAFELAERDLTAEGTAWDSKTRTLFLSSMYKRKIVAIAPDGGVRDRVGRGLSPRLSPSRARRHGPEDRGAPERNRRRVCRPALLHDGALLHAG